MSRTYKKPQLRLFFFNETEKLHRTFHSRNILKMGIKHQNSNLLFQLGGVFASVIPNLEDGTFDLDLLESKIRPSEVESHETITGLICLENTNNRCGGKVLSLSYIQKVWKFTTILKFWLLWVDVSQKIFTNQCFPHVYR